MGTPRTRRGHRERRHLRVRSKVKGTAERPRLAVFRSLRHIYAQVVDDVRGVTVAAASSLDPAIRKDARGPKTEVSGQVGSLIAERAVAVGVGQVVFDRGGNKYHGRVRELAEAARKQGLVF